MRAPLRWRVARSPPAVGGGVARPCRQPLRRARRRAPALPQPADRARRPTSTSSTRRRPASAPAGDQRRAQPRPRADGAARHAQRPALDAGQPADLPASAAAIVDLPHRGDAPLHRRRRRLRRLLLEGPPARSLRALVASTATAGSLRRGPHRPEAQLLPARPRADPAGAPLARLPRTTPAATRTPTATRVTLGTSVGWSDIYPADYDRQWISVAGLRGCFAFVMTVDPQNLLFESNEHDNTLPAASSACPSAASRGC